MKLTWAPAALQSRLSWTVECSKASLSCVVTCAHGGFYCLFSVYALTFMRTEILYLENTVSPLNDCVYYNSSTTEVGRKYTETCIPLSSFQAQASSVSLHGAWQNCMFPSLCLPAICHAGTGMLWFWKVADFPLTSYAGSRHVLPSQLPFSLPGLGLRIWFMYFIELEYSVLRCTSKFGVLTNLCCRQAAAAFVIELYWLVFHLGEIHSRKRQAGLLPGLCPNTCLS